LFIDIVSNSTQALIVLARRIFEEIFNGNHVQSV